MKISVVVKSETELAAKQERAFAEYAALAQRAQSTLDIDNAIAAGKAWSRFVYLFCGAGADD